MATPVAVRYYCSSVLSVLVLECWGYAVADEKAPVENKYLLIAVAVAVVVAVVAVAVVIRSAAKKENFGLL